MYAQTRRLKALALGLSASNGVGFGNKTLPSPMRPPYATARIYCLGRPRSRAVTCGFCSTASSQITRHVHDRIVVITHTNIEYRGLDYLTPTVAPRSCNQMPTNTLPSLHVAMWSPCTTMTVMAEEPPKLVRNNRMLSTHGAHNRAHAHHRAIHSCSPSNQCSR